MKSGFFVGLCLLLAACATAPNDSGVYISDADLKALKPGITTLNEVEAKFGAPQQSVTNSDGSTELQYVYVKGQGSQSGEFLKRLNPFAISNVQSAQITTYRVIFRNDKFVSYRVAQNGGSTANPKGTR